MAYLRQPSIAGALVANLGQADLIAGLAQTPDGA